jgi:hypothetical protein
MKGRHTSVVPAYGALQSIKTYQLQYRLPDGNYKQLLDDEGFAIELLSIAAAYSIAKTLATCDSYPQHGWKIVCSDGMHKFI